jgi:hypothetical protein
MSSSPKVNLVRSEQIPEVQPVSTGVGDIYSNLKKAIHDNDTKGISVGMLQIGSIGLLILMFGFAFNYSTQRLSKLRGSTMQQQRGPAGADEAAVTRQAVPKFRPARPLTSAGTTAQSSKSSMPAKAAQPSRPPMQKADNSTGFIEWLRQSVGTANGPQQAAPPKAGPKAKAKAKPKAKESPAPKVGPLSPYPWHTLPTPEMLLSVGPSYHINLKNALPDMLSKRGLQPAGKDNVAMIALWNWPGQRQRALAELCVRDTLANKRSFATHLAESGLKGIAPLTFLSPSELRGALSPQQGQAMPKHLQDGLWFLKHAGKDNNLGVTCFHGVHALLKHWEGAVPDGIQKWERLHYVAQVEVKQPLLFTTLPGQGEKSDPENASAHKVTFRAYVLVLGTGRCFLHREMLIKGHPHPYDESDPDPMKHVLCHVKYHGVTAARATHWPQYAAIWPKVADMMARCFRSFDFEALQDEAIFDDEFFSVLCRIWGQLWDCIATLPLLRTIFRRRRRGIEEADSMKYALLGLDVIVDEDLRPWCLELNRSPTLNREERDPIGSTIKDQVVEDFCELLIDPILRAAAKVSQSRPSQGQWHKLQQWANENALRRHHESHRGFVDISSLRARS